MRLSTAALDANAAAVATYLGIEAGDRAALTLPVHYCYGLSVGRRSRFVKPFGIRIDLDGVEKLLAGHGIDAACGGPTRCWSSRCGARTASIWTSGSGPSSPNGSPFR